MDQGSLLDEFAQVRHQVIALCSKNRFSAAQMLLVGSGHTPGQSPGLWEHIARCAAQAGHGPIAAEVRKHIWAAGGRHERLTLDEAEYSLKRSDHQNAIFVIEGHFGALPAHPDALEILTRAYMRAAEDVRDGARLRTSREAALRLTDVTDFHSVQHAMAAVDLLRYCGEFDRASALNARAISAFPDDPRFLMRQARMDEQKARFEPAIEVWKQVAAQSERYRTEALFRLYALQKRLEQFDEAEAVAAQLLREDLETEERVTLSLQVGQRPLTLAILRALSTSQHAIEALSFEQGRIIGDALLDHGEVGLLVWLRRRRMPLGDRVKKVLDRCGFGEAEGPEMPDDFEAATKIRSPDVMLPLDAFAGLPAKAPGWPGQRAEPGRVLLVNSYLNAGGAERQLVALAKAMLAGGLAKDDLHVALFSLESDRGQDAFLPDLERLGVTIHNLSSRPIHNAMLPPGVERVIGALPFGLRQDATQMWHLLTQLKPNVVHAWQDRSAAACGIAGVLCETERLVLSMRNMAPTTRRDGTLLQSKALMSGLGRLDNVTLTTNAKAAARDYEAWLNLSEGNVQPLRNIVDVEQYEPVRAAYLARQAEKRVRIGGVFRLALNKRPLLWLKTVAALRELDVFPIMPVLFGRGPMLDQVRDEAVRLGLTDFELVTDATDPLQIYSSMDALLLMSRVEGLPNVLLEAQACGLPVAACDVGGVGETLQKRGDAGALLMPGDVSPGEAAEQIAAWLPTARAAPVDPRVGFIRKNFSAEAVVKPLLETYCGRGAVL